MSGKTLTQNTFFGILQIVWPLLIEILLKQYYDWKLGMINVIHFLLCDGKKTSL